MLNPVVHQELSGDKSSGHDHPGSETHEEPAHARLLREDLEAVRHRSCRAVTFIYLRQQCVCGLLPSCIKQSYK